MFLIRFFLFWSFFYVIAIDILLNRFSSRPFVTRSKVMVWCCSVCTWFPFFRTQCGTQASKISLFFWFYLFSKYFFLLDPQRNFNTFCLFIHFSYFHRTTTKTSKKGERFNEIVKKNVNNLQTIKNSNRKQYEFVYVSKHIFMETIQHSHWFIHNTLLLIARVFVFFVFVCCCWFEQRIEKEKQSAIFIQCLYSPMQNIFVSFELFLLYSIRLEQFSLE